MDSLFFQLHLIREADSTMTALQREMLGMTLAANPGVSLGDAVKDVFDFLGVKLKPKRLEAICKRLIEENEQRPQDEAEDPAEPRPAPREQKGGTFGKELIKWIEGMHSSDRLLTALGYNATLAQQIYCEQDYLVTDTICKLFLEDRWNESLIHLQAAAAPWMGGGKAGDANTEIIDLSMADESDPGWAELEACFNRR